MFYRISQSSLDQDNSYKRRNVRGINVWSSTELRAQTGMTKRGEVVTGFIQMPMFNLRPEERQAAMQVSSYVQSVIGSRMLRLSAMEWTITPKKNLVDFQEIRMRNLKMLYDEYDDPNDIQHLLVRYRCVQIMKEEMPDLRKDLANFEGAFLRYKRAADVRQSDSSQKVIDWINSPNLEDDYQSFTEKYYESLLLHGAKSVYKEWLEDTIDNVYVLPGGSVYPMRSFQVGGYVSYIQLLDFIDTPKIYFQDEIAFSNYLPSAARSYGYVPIDSLVNKIAEQILFDQFASERADGTKEPEKLIVLGDNKSPFGDFEEEFNMNTPIDDGEAKRIEEKINMARRGALAVLSGVGTPIIEDISKADTYGIQSDRQDKLLRDIALVFHLTNMEINLAGGQFTSGKETSETQQEIDEGKGTAPLKKDYETFWNKSVLPYRYGTYWVYQFKKGLSEKEQVELDTARVQSGTWTKNETRKASGRDPIIAEGNDSLQDATAANVNPNGSKSNPFNIKGLEIGA